MDTLAAEIVVDTSALLAVVLGEPERPALIARTQGATLLAPGSVPWEVGNTLIAGFRRRRLDARQVGQAWTFFERIPLRLVSITVNKALELAEQLGLDAYDAYILEAVRVHRVPLLTMDHRLKAAAGQLGLETWEITS